MDTRSREPVVLARLRRLLLATLAGGMVGTLVELLLLGHFESATQWIPLVLLALGLAVVSWHAASPRAASVRTLQVTMGLFLSAGLNGIGLQYDGNVEFELEITPGMSGLELIEKAMTGATPVMAPGAMALLGVIGLAHTYGHPHTAFNLEGDR
jgi:hypothetical protein